MPLPLPTLGGRQFWTDLRLDRGWRIQRHALTGHCRLLDPYHLRRTWGTLAECEAALDRHLGPPPAVGAREIVLLLHGLGRTRWAMRAMGDYLRDRGLDAVEFSYASTRATVSQHAEALASVVSCLPCQRVSFVGHSLGNLVVRRYLRMWRRPDRTAVGRVVMLAPPNSGSSLAARLRRNPMFLLAMGPCGQEIAEWHTLEASLGTPAEFGVIAGRYPTRNPLLNEAGDLVVTVEETKLAGMSDFRVVEATHTFIMCDPDAMRQTEAFLKTGRFL